jgi:radical SAM superfamily enzyme YgiQ (UPF0313 family)
MRYEGIIYRPPSEADSLIVQATLGCAHNGCSFCSMYKSKRFRIKNTEEICMDLEEERKKYKRIKRIFLADGDALVIQTQDLMKILKKIKELFPECERVGIYGTPKDINSKSADELKLLSSMGLGIIYMGIESGSDRILKSVNKGVTSEEIVRAGESVVKSGMKLSTTLISGLGGKELYLEHAIESARVISEINPHYVGLLTLMVEKGTRVYEDVRNRTFELLTPDDIMVETYKFLESLDVSGCIFRSNHASNYVPLGGRLPDEKEKLLKLIKDILEGKYKYREEFNRRL